MKIGLFGGSFDPIHNGHLMLAEQTLNDLKLDRVWFVPCSQSPYLNKNILTDSKDRLEMVKLAIRSNSKFDCSAIELLKTWGKSYTIETVKDMLHYYPRYEFCLILGPDITDIGFNKWKEAKEIKKLIKVYFARHNDFYCPNISIRSTLIRQMVKEGKSIKYLVPDSVEKYIKEKGLYK